MKDLRWFIEASKGYMRYEHLSLIGKLIFWYRLPFKYKTFRKLNKG